MSPFSHSLFQLKQELKAVEGNYQGLNTRVGSLSNELSVISERLEEIKDTMNDRGQSMTDTSPLVKIRAALQAVKVSSESHRQEDYMNKPHAVNDMIGLCI